MKVTVPIQRSNSHFLNSLENKGPSSKEYYLFFKEGFTKSEKKKTGGHGAMEWRSGQRGACSFRCTPSDPQANPQRCTTLHSTEGP
jgi:hypothetical protein